MPGFTESRELTQQPPPQLRMNNSSYVATPLQRCRPCIPCQESTDIEALRGSSSLPFALLSLLFSDNTSPQEKKLSCQLGGQFQHFDPGQKWRAELLQSVLPSMRGERTQKVAMPSIALPPSPFDNSQETRRGAYCAAAACQGKDLGRQAAPQEDEIHRRGPYTPVCT